MEKQPTGPQTGLLVILKVNQSVLSPLIPWQTPPKASKEHKVLTKHNPQILRLIILMPTFKIQNSINLLFQIQSDQWGT